MLRILLVDDEKLIRAGIAKIISNSDNNYEIVGQASNGLEAIHFLKNNHIDIVITDIKMPQMNGIELTEHINKNFPNIHTIILSGYDDYEYVRTTMKNGAFDYLLKPVENEELITVLEKIKADLAVDKSIEIPAATDEKAYHYYGLHEFKKAFSDVLNNKLLPCNMAVVALFDIQKHQQFSQKDEGLENITDKLTAVITSIIKHSELNIRYIHHNKYLIFIGNTETDANFQSQVINTVKCLSKDLREILEVKLSAGIGFYNEGNFVFDELVQQAVSALEHLKMYEHTAEIIVYSEMLPYKAPDADEFLSWEKKFMDAIDILDKQLAKNLAFSLFNYLEVAYFPPDDIRKIIKNLVYKINFSNSDFNNYIKTKYKDISFVIEQINKMYPITNIKLFFRDLIVEAVETITLTKGIGNNKIIEKAKSYINANYKNDITLKDVARYVNLNPTYFSEFFKAETNETFINYLTNVRIEAAKGLLINTDMKIDDVGYTVGYETIAYFSRLFKKKTGITPSGYRKKKQGAAKIFPTAIGRKNDE